MNAQQKITDDEKVAAIRKYKEKGNDVFKAGNFKKAASQYYRGIMYVKSLSSVCPNPDFLSSLGGASSSDGLSAVKPLNHDEKMLICDCYNNLAACMLKEDQPKYERIVEHCNSALEMIPQNAKSLYRKGVALYHLKNYEDALETFQSSPSDVGMKKYIEHCKFQLKEQEKEMAAAYKKIFQYR